MFTLVSSAFFLSPGPHLLPLLYTCRSVAHICLTLYLHVSNFLYMACEIRQTKNEIVLKTAGKLCNSREIGHTHILYCKVAQQTEFVISEAGRVLFFPPG